MFDDREMSADDVKKILMLYGNLQRLEVLNQKIEKNNMQSIKKELAAIKNIKDTNKRNVELEKCVLHMADKWEETRVNINLCNVAIQNILLAFEKLILVNRESTTEAGGYDGME